MAARNPSTNADRSVISVRAVTPTGAMTALERSARPVPAVPAAPVALKGSDRSWSRARAVFAAAALTAQLWAGAVEAQLGPFVSAEPYWNGPIGGAGVQFNGPLIWVDVNGNDLVDSGIDTVHPIPNGVSSAAWALRLSPSRRVMVAFSSTGQNCPGTPTSIRLYSIPTVNGSPMVLLGLPQTLDGCIEQVGFFDDPTQAVRTAFFREPADVSGRADILWWNLLTGETARSPFPYDQSFGYVDFAPSGTMAWVQHGINAPQGTKYSIVALCPPQLGQASQPGLTNQVGALRAAVENGTSGLVVTARNSGGPVVASFNYLDCALPPPQLGACCLPSGGCAEGLTEGQCTGDYSGTWNGAGSTCATADCPSPPAPELAVSMTGPATGEKGALLTYTLTARNDGDAQSTSLTVVDSLPAGMVFVSASHDGAIDFNRRVIWSIPTLWPGFPAVRTVTVRSLCNATSLVNNTYRITGNPGGTVAGSPAVTTTLSDAPVTPLTISVTSQPQAPLPLHTGDRTRHTIQLTNTIAQTRGGVKFLFSRGLVSDVVQIVNAAGGTLTNFGNSTQWEGPIAASATIQIVYETAIRECRASDASTEQMNGGLPLSFLTSCNQSLGFTFPPAGVAVAGSPFALRLGSPTHPVQSIQSQAPGPPSGIAIARPGATVDLQLRFIRSDALPAPACSMSAVLPEGLSPAGNPPFIGTPPAGTTWNAADRTIAWRGTPPANDSVVVAFRVVLESGCLSAILASADHGACTNAFQYSLGLAAVPPPPAGAHLVGLHSQGLQTWTPGAAEWQPLLCGDFGYLRGVGRTPDGTLWVAGDPTFRLNPSTLSFQIFPASFGATLGMDYPFDVAGDPRDSTVVFAGYQSGIGLRVRRYDPKNSAVSFILNDLAPMTFGPANSVVVSGDGTMGVQTASTFLKIPAANPASYSVFDDASVQATAAAALDADGNYLVVEMGTASRRLFKIDRTSGAYTSLVDLGPSVDPEAFLRAVDSTPALDVYYGDDQGAVHVVHRSAGNSFEALPSLPDVEDLLYVDGPTVSVEPIEPSAAPRVLQLAPGMPNPFRAVTLLRFSLPSEGDVTLDLYDLSGRRVRTLARGSAAAGEHAFAWDGRDDGGSRLGAGLYFVRLSFGGEARKTKLILAP